MSEKFKMENRGMKVYYNGNLVVFNRVRTNQRKDLEMPNDSVVSGQVVTMEYTLHVDGEILDSSKENGPLEFLAGYNNIISGLEREMLGMKVGEDKNVVVSPRDGYGEFDSKAFVEMKKNDIPKDIPLEVGVELNMSDKDGHQHYARIDSVANDLVRLDLNHPLAGRELHFNVKVVGLREPTAEELEHGHVHEGGGHQH
jgi:FKBP-type peptidyl-prolyl cis-trans isomerase SlyD